MLLLECERISTPMFVSLLTMSWSSLLTSSSTNCSCDDDVHSCTDFDKVVVSVYAGEDTCGEVEDMNASVVVCLEVEELLFV